MLNISINTYPNSPENLGALLLMFLFTQHIKNLCKRHCIRALFVHTDPEDGEALVSKRIIFIARITSEKAYCIALHEIGHIVNSRPVSKLDNEMDAWDFAADNALIWTEEMSKVRRKCMKAYIRVLGRDKRFATSERAAAIV